MQAFYPTRPSRGLPAARRGPAPRDMSSRRRGPHPAIRSAPRPATACPSPVGARARHDALGPQPAKDRARRAEARDPTGPPADGPPGGQAARAGWGLRKAAAARLLWAESGARLRQPRRRTRRPRRRPPPRGALRAARGNAVSCSGAFSRSLSVLLSAAWRSALRVQLYTAAPRQMAALSERLAVRRRGHLAGVIARGHCKKQACICRAEGRPPRVQGKPTAVDSTHADKRVRTSPPN